MPLLTSKFVWLIVLKIPVTFGIPYMHEQCVRKFLLGFFLEFPTAETLHPFYAKYAKRFMSAQGYAFWSS